MAYRAAGPEFRGGGRGGRQSQIPLEKREERGEEAMKGTVAAPREGIQYDKSSKTPRVALTPQRISQGSNGAKGHH